MILDKTLAKAWFARETMPLFLSADHYFKAGVKVITVEFPIVEVGLLWKALDREIWLRIEAPDYNYIPIRGYWIDENRNPLLKGRGIIPFQLGFQTEDGHPYGLRRTWFCFPGWREYHDHQGHQNVPWASIRHNSQYTIPALIMQLNSDLNRAGVKAV